MSLCPPPPLQDEGDYLCVKVLRHSKSKKTMVSMVLKYKFILLASKVSALFFLVPSGRVVLPSERKSCNGLCFTTVCSSDVVVFNGCHAPSEYMWSASPHQKERVRSKSLPRKGTCFLNVE